MTILEANEDNLSDIMEFDCPIEVTEDSTVVRASDDVWAPELYLEVDENGQAYDDSDADLNRQAHSAGWELLTGYTGQHGYNGPVLHSSETISGRLAQDILETPGIYVAVEISVLPPDEDEETTPAGWVIAKKTP